MNMASGYEQFTNEGCDKEGVRHDVPPPPSYEQNGMNPTAPPCYHPDQTPCPMEKVPGQQPSPYQEQQASQYPQQAAPQYGHQEPSQYPAQYPPQQQSQFPLTQPSGFPSQQPSQYPPEVQSNTYVYQPQVTQPPDQQNIVHVTNQTMPNDYLCFAIFVTLFCCLPFGIVAIIKSSEVKSRSAAGDYHGAAIASAEVKRWATIGLIFGGIAIAVSVMSSVISATTFSY